MRHLLTSFTVLALSLPTLAQVPELADCIQKKGKRECAVRTIPMYRENTVVAACQMEVEFKLQDGSYVTESITGWGDDKTTHILTDVATLGLSQLALRTMVTRSAKSKLAEKLEHLELCSEHDRQ